MKWLQWSTVDLEKGLGGVEVYAPSIARELTRLGVDTHFSSDPKDLKNSNWDVVQTHGSSFARCHPKSVSVHTLHGTTLERMIACREFFWPMGYVAWTKEVLGTLCSDVTLAVHPDISLYRWSKKLSKVSRVCWNGWDARETASVPLPIGLREKIESLDRPFWVFVGRGDDVVKGVDRVHFLLDASPEIRLVAAPGAGFENRSDVITTGRLSSDEVGSLMSMSQGLLLTSYFEGNSLVVLEALAQGVPVVSTAVGAVSLLPETIRGLFVVPSLRNLAELNVELKAAMAKAMAMDLSDHGRQERARNNRTILPDWASVAKKALASVEEVLRVKRRESRTTGN